MLLQRVDLVGMTFGRLKVLEFSYKKRNANFWKVACACGTIKILSVLNFKYGNTKSCGCLKSETISKAKKTHGHSVIKSDEYRAWKHLRGRCCNPNNHKYPNYGGRGIKVCDRWMKFENFLEDMGKKPTPKHSVDRINNHGDYEPNNCRWATNKEQSRNRTDNLYLETDYGKMILADACAKYKIGRHLLYYRATTRNISRQQAFNQLLEKRGMIQ